MAISYLPLTIAVVVGFTSAILASPLWGNSPGLAQFPPEWVNSQLQPRRLSLQQHAGGDKLQRPSLASAVTQQRSSQPLSPFELQQQQQQLSALLAPYLSSSSAAAEADSYPPASSFSDSALHFDNALTGAADDNNDLVQPEDVDARELAFGGSNGNSDALSPYAMELLREAYLAQVPVAEFKPIYGDNNNLNIQAKPSAKGVSSSNANNKIIPTTIGDAERMFADNMFGPIVASKSFKSLDSSSGNSKDGSTARKASKAESKAYVETRDNIDRNTYSKLTSAELRLNAEKRLSDISSASLLSFGGGEDALLAASGGNGGGGAFGSSAQAMFAGKSRLSIMAVVFACTGAAIFGTIAAATFYRRVKTRRGGNGNDSNYPAYGVTGPIKPPSSLDLTAGDRKLAKSAETYHYQNQKRAMLASERHVGLGGKTAAAAAGVAGAGDESDSDLDEGSECGDYTVYECPGLAPAGCMEVQNPLFIGSDAESISPRSDRAEE